jgi:Uma2 family endonuclease
MGQSEISRHRSKSEAEMASAAIKPRVSPEEYLAMERKAEFKSEYFDGYLYAMAGASAEHNRLALDLATELNARLRGGPCEVFNSDLRVLVNPSGLYTYPDLVAVCGGPEFEDGRKDTLLNPTLIVEVLSPSTESYDRGEKFAQYRQLPSLREYVLVSQDRVAVERFARKGDQWILTSFDKRDAVVELASVGCEIPLAEIYRRVDVPDGYAVLRAKTTP